MTRTRPNPRISISKLAEYVVASPSRRRSILRDQKFPAPFKAGTFRDVFPAITTALVQNHGGNEIDAEIERRRTRTPSSAFDARSTTLGIAALEAFRELVVAGAFRGYTFAAGLAAAYVELSGVDLSVRPEVLIGGPEPGAVKIYLAKTSPLTADVRGRPYTATALHLWAEQNFSSAPAERCLVVDVFEGEVYEAPVRNITRRRDLEAACEEISTRWPVITAPPVIARP